MNSAVNHGRELPTMEAANDASYGAFGIQDTDRKRSVRNAYLISHNNLDLSRC